MQNKAVKISKILDHAKIVRQCNGVFYSLTPNNDELQTSGTGQLGFVKDLFKRFPAAYNAIKRVVKPTYSSSNFAAAVKRTTSPLSSDAIVLNIGSGPSSDSSNTEIINMDYFPFKGVDIVSDITDMPLLDNSVDSILIISVLEHVRESAQCVTEIYRTLKPGGKVLVQVPFLFPYHAAPDDYLRWTIKGIEKEFSRFQVLELGPSSGPTSALLAVFVEWLSILCSAGSKKVHDIIYMVASVVFSPFKLIDIVLLQYKTAIIAPGGVYLVAQKPTPDPEG